MEHTNIQTCIPTNKHSDIWTNKHTNLQAYVSHMSNTIILTMDWAEPNSAVHRVCNIILNLSYDFYEKSYGQVLSL